MTSGRREYPPFVSYLIATLMAVSLLSLQTTLPFKLKELGAPLASVGFLFMWTSFWYVMAGLFLSWITHYAGPRQVMLVTLAICSVMALLLPFANTIWHVWGLATGYFVSACLFWAAMEHASTSLHSKLTLIQSTTLFGVAFSIGNVIGLMSSSLLQSRTTAVPFFVSAGVLVVVMFLTWLTVAPAASFRLSSAHAIDAFLEADRQRLRRSLLASRIGLTGSYGMYAIISLFLPRYLWEHRGFSKPLAGGLTTIMLVSMGIVFALHGRRSDWPHRLWVVRLCPLGAGLCVLIAGLSSIPIIIAGGVILIGAFAATAYSHNLYYSLEEPGKRARNAGIHEAIVGTAFMIPPALGGLAARYTDAPESIFWAGAAFALVVSLVQNAVLVVARKKELFDLIPAGPLDSWRFFN